LARKQQTSVSGTAGAAGPEGVRDERTFEEAVEAVESTVHLLEEGKLPLADAVDHYERGVKSLGRCYELLDQAEQRIELLRRVGPGGVPETEPFVESPGATALEAGRRSRAGRVPDEAGPVGRAGDQGIDVDDADRLF
jgi:exodeoxyribonuclease VII small subunit